MGNWYLVVKTIEGRRYRYRQRTWREGEKVCTKSEYLGRAEPGEFTPKRARRPIPTEEAIRLWDAGRLVSSSIADVLEQRSIDALQNYTSDGHLTINRWLRSDLVIPEDSNEAMSALLSAIEQHSAIILKDAKLYRKCIIPANACRIGGCIFDPAFMSFSIDPSISHIFETEPPDNMRQVTLVLSVKAGSRGYISAKGFTFFDSEKEIIRAGGRFIIIDIIEENRYTTCIIEEMEVVYG